MTTALDWWTLIANWLVFVVAFAAHLRGGAPGADSDARDSALLSSFVGGAVVLTGALLRAPPPLWWFTLAPFMALMLFTAWTAVRETYTRRDEIRRAAASRALTLREGVVVGSLAASVAAVPIGLIVGLLGSNAETLRLAAAAGTLASAILWHLNWVLYRRWLSNVDD
jgi:hypothetical protein